MIISEDTKIMANLLRAGYTMLNMSCPICKNPIFQDKKERKFCPICNREVIIVNDENNLPNKDLDPHIDNYIEKNISQYSNQSKIFQSLKKVILKKIKIINDKLAVEDQIDIIKSYSKILLNLLKILTYLKDIKSEDK